MLRSMFSGVSGLRSHQTMMDVIGNNIANVNTAGYKSGNVVFQDLLSQTIRGAGVPAANAGGTNPTQVGLGVRVGGVNTSFTQGASQMTGRATDLSIQGDGFFVVRSAGQELYTRAGSLSFDALGRLVTPDGGVLQGWTADGAGAINTNAGVTDLRMPLGQTITPSQTGNITLGGNLPADIDTGTELVTSITVYDAQGAPRDVTLTFEKTGANAWTATATMRDTGGGADVQVGTTNMTWDPAATPPAWTAPPALTITPTPATGEFTGTIEVGFGTAGSAEAVTQYAGSNSIAALNQDGSAIGALQSFTIGQDGIVTGVFSNGRTRAVGQVALATFGNPGGLEKVGGSLFRPSVNSGLAQVGIAGQNGRGALAGSTLEMSNVDLAAEFTNLIVAQRGFQANSRVITASDELLQDLVNLKR
jgi:flagellar hook protein FlgE